MDWTRERWIKLYTRDSGDWLFLSFDAQALFLMLLRKVDRRGCLALGKNGKAALAVVLGHGATQDVTRIAAALEVLITDRTVIVDGEVLLIPNFETAQLARTSDAERSRRKREKAETVTPRHSKTRKVTAGHDLEETRLDKKRREEKEPSAALRARLVPAGATVATRKAYLGAYEKRWGALPVADENGNGKMNGQLARLVKLLGEEESPHVAAYFLTTNDALYVRAKHPTDLLLRDAGKLRAEWAGAPRSTATEARQTDKTEANARGWGRLLKGTANGVE